MRSTFFWIIILLVAAAFFGACGGAPANNATSNNANAPARANGANDPLATKTAAPEATTNDAPTLTPTYKAYCTAMVKKDEAGLRKVFSRDTIQFFENDMQEENIKTLVQYLSDEEVTTDLCEVRNEQITGDTAVAEVRTKGYPNGIKVVFVKESGEWKLTNRSPALDNVKGQTNSPNSR
jgi:hypothetical protein